MHATGVARAWLTLAGARRDEIVGDTVGGEQFGIIKITDHAVVGEVFEQKRYPAVGVRPDGKGHGVANQAAPHLDGEGFGGLGNCRLRGSASTIRLYLCVSRTDGYHGASSPCPLLCLDNPVDAWGNAVTDEKVTVKLHVGQTLAS